MVYKGDEGWRREKEKEMKEKIDEEEEEMGRKEKEDETEARGATPVAAVWGSEDVREKKVKTEEIPNNSLN